jgi:tetratricopeptide (TPR) repeat protein
MTLSNRIRCSVELAIMMLAVAIPSFAQISSHRYVSECDQTKAASDYANDPANRGWMERMEELVGRGTVQKVSKSTPRSSLAKYCIAEFLLEKHNYQASVNAYRDSLAGDGNPVWTKVWSHIQIGKIFDVTGQRERAVREYKLAIQTGDNTDGAINQARELLQHPFELPETQ